MNVKYKISGMIILETVLYRYLELFLEKNIIYHVSVKD